MRVPILAFAKGFKETLTSMTKAPVTVEYPEEMRDVPENWRGRIKLYLDLCVGCTTCSMVCPNASCQMEALDYQAPKNKRAIFPRVDIVSCIYCGLCEETCPTDAIRLDKEFKLSEYDRGVFDYDSYELSKREGQLELERENEAKAG
ncbi:MAG TPA: NADH-quinone oxidoreductase subunit I [Candidatus Thermoplasmatota archaeon]|nr:NADH-quinone oxidoreductase subunit I [Candidatus Thermoplasmatota archaeon]